MRFDKNIGHLVKLCENHWSLEDGYIICSELHLSKRTDALGVPTKSVTYRDSEVREYRIEEVLFEYEKKSLSYVRDKSNYTKHLARNSM